MTTIPEDIQGFGEASLADLAEMRKALEIGYTQPTTGTGFDALRVESLDSTLRSLTYTQDTIRLWNRIPKDTAYSTVEEYNMLVSYGSDGGGFVASGALPEEEDSTYQRSDQKVKYLGTTRAVHHPATLVRTVPADLIAQETQNGALWLMGKANYALYNADSDVIPKEFNSLTKQIIEGNGIVIDLEGQPLAPTDLEDATQRVGDNFGRATSFFTNGKVFSDFSTQFYGLQRFNSPGSRSVPGTPIDGWQTQGGQVTFEPDIFVKQGGAPKPIATNAKSPPAPTVQLGAPGANSGSKFKSSDAGSYKWQITAVNEFGESAPTPISASAALSAGDAIALTITDGGGTYQATGYKIYRTEKNGLTTFWTNKAIPRAKTGGTYVSQTVWTDLNEWRPKCFSGLLLDMTPQSLTFKQLAPMLKMNLAIISPAIRWMQLLYGTPIVFMPGRNVVFKNIGVAS